MTPHHRQEGEPPPALPLPGVDGICRIHESRHNFAAKGGPNPCPGGNNLAFGKLLGLRCLPVGPLASMGLKRLGKPPTRFQIDTFYLHPIPSTPSTRAWSGAMLGGSQASGMAEPHVAGERRRVASSACPSRGAPVQGGRDTPEIPQGYPGDGHPNVSRRYPGVIPRDIRTPGEALGVPPGGVPSSYPGIPRGHLRGRVPSGISQARVPARGDCSSTGVASKKQARRKNSMSKLTKEQMLKMDRIGSNLAIPPMLRSRGILSLTLPPSSRERFCYRRE
jgi:hypothetical protein